MATNHFLRDHEPWTPFLGTDNGRDDVYGLLRINGSNNSIIGNHFSEVIDSQTIRPTGATPVIIRLTAGSGNYVSSNHAVAMDVHAKSSDSAFAAQVDALLTTEASDGLAITAVMVDSASARNTILDSGSDTQVLLDRTVNAFRATPVIGRWLAGRATYTHLLEIVPGDGCPAAASPCDMPSKANCPSKWNRAAPMPEPDSRLANSHLFIAASGNCTN
nr:hypothetical protein [Arthrobacter sp. SDTb3-6]